MMTIVGEEKYTRACTKFRGEATRGEHRKFRPRGKRFSHWPVFRRNHQNERHSQSIELSNVCQIVIVHSSWNVCVLFVCCCFLSYHAFTGFHCFWSLYATEVTKIACFHPFMWCELVAVIGGCCGVEKNCFRAKLTSFLRCLCFQWLGSRVFLSPLLMPHSCSHFSLPEKCFPSR